MRSQDPNAVRIREDLMKYLRPWVQFPELPFARITIHMEEIPDNYDDLTEDMKRQLFNSKLVQKGLAYQRISNGLEMLKEEDPAVYDQLIAGIKNRQSRVNSEDTIEEIIDAMISEVQDHTDLMEEDEEDEF